MARTTLVRTFALLTTLVAGGLGRPAEAAPITIGSFSSPGLIAAGTSGTFELLLQLTPTAGLIGEFISAASFTFSSGEGETATDSTPGPLSATFLFETAGTYTVTASGTATSTGTELYTVYETVATTVYVPRYDANLNLIGYDTVIRYDTVSRVESRTVTHTNPLLALLQVEVYQPQIITPGGGGGGGQDPAPVPEPASILLLGSGTAALIAARKRLTSRR